MVTDTLSCSFLDCASQYMYMYSRPYLCNGRFDRLHVCNTDTWHTEDSGPDVNSIFILCDLRLVFAWTITYLSRSARYRAKRPDFRSFVVVVIRTKAEGLLPYHRSTKECTLQLFQCTCMSPVRQALQESIKNGRVRACNCTSDIFHNHIK